MVKRKSTKEKLVEENEQEEETKKSSLILLSSSDEEEANEDLSLQIVEKARLREATKRKREKSEATVIDLSSSSCEEVNGFSNRRGVVTPGKEVEEKKKKRNKRKKKKKNQNLEEEQEDKSVGVRDIEDPVETITSLEPEDRDKVEAVEITDNIVLRKLLRGPRYFDPPERSCRTCYNCGEEGHNAVNCTSKKRKKPCFICGSFDHGVRNCTQGQDCFICNKQGHRAKDCPEKYQAKLQDTKICLRCGDVGHLMSSCSREYDPEDLKEIQCYVCKMPGHLCCVDSIEPGLGEVSCYNCGQSGHTGTGCAKQRGEANGAGQTTLCYKCGEEGHFARGCTKNSKPDHWMGESSTPTRKQIKKGKDSNGYRSAPPDLSHIHRKKNTQYEERDFTTEGRSKRRGGWIADDPVGYPNRKAKDKGWRSPVTPTKRVNKNPVHKSPARTSGGHSSNSRFPWKQSNSTPRTPSSHGSSHHPYHTTPTYPRTPTSHGSAYPPYPMPPTSHGPAYPHHHMPPASHGSAYPPHHMPPASHGFSNTYHNAYTPSRYGNSNGGGGRRQYW